MSYTKQTWNIGDIITAAKLNHMEDGIANGGGGSDDSFVVTFTTTDSYPSSSSTFTADKTYSECVSALNADKKMMAIVETANDSQKLNFGSYSQQAMMFRFYAVLYMNGTFYGQEITYAYNERTLADEVTYSMGSVSSGS